MNKQKVEKKAEQKEILHALKMKYFWQQKAEEIGKFLIVFLGTIFVPYLFGRFLYLITPISSRESFWGEMNIFLYWVWGVLTLIILLCIIALIVLIIKLIRIWIKSNLKKAELRARKELKIK